MANEKLFYIGVKGLIKNKEGEYLLLKANVSTHSKNTKEYWDIPGGRIKQGDDVVTTLKREIEEEIGLAEISEIQFLTSVVSNHEVPINESQTAGLVLMVYTVKIPEDATIKLDPAEIVEYEWVDTQTAASRLANKYPIELTSALT